MADRLFINRKQDFKDTQKRHAIVHRLQIRPMLHGLYIILVLSCLIVACFSFYKISHQMELGIERVQACTRSHFAFALQHPAVWTKWNGVFADNVAHAAGASILLLARGVFASLRSACGGPGGLPLGRDFWCQSPGSAIVWRCLRDRTFSRFARTPRPSCATGTDRQTHDDS